MSLGANSRRTRRWLGRRVLVQGQSATARVAGPDRPHANPAPSPRPRPRGPRPRPTFDARHGGDVAPGSTTRAVAGRPETRGGGQTTPGSARRCTSAGGSRGGVEGTRGRFGAGSGPAFFLRGCGAGRGVRGRSVVPGEQRLPEVSPGSRERSSWSSWRRGRWLCGLTSRAHFAGCAASPFLLSPASLRHGKRVVSASLLGVLPTSGLR